MTFALLYAGTLCLILGAGLLGVSRRRLQARHAASIAALGSAHQVEIDKWRERYKRLAARYRELERELIEIRLGTATAGYTFDQVPARTIPARVRMVKAK